MKSENKLSNCVFSNIKSLTSDKHSENIYINDCKFIDIIIDNINGNFISIYGSTKYNPESRIQNCLFENITIKTNGYIINARTEVYSKSYIVNVENCAFVNCISPRELISLTDSYVTKFPKKTKFVTLGVTENCVGL